MTVNRVKINCQVGLLSNCCIEGSMIEIPVKSKTLQMTDRCETLKNNNDQICDCIKALKQQRDEIEELILKQQVERKTLQSEMDRVTYKLSLVTKSLNQRISTRNKYDETIREAEAFYKTIVDSSSKLLGNVQKDKDVLLETIDKKVGTEISKPAHFSSRTSEMGQQKYRVTRARSLSMSYEAMRGQIVQSSEHFTIKEEKKRRRKTNDYDNIYDVNESDMSLTEGQLVLNASGHSLGY